MIYKKKRGKKWFSRSYFFLIAGSAPMPGVGLVSCGVSWLGELVPVFWSMELDLVSLKGSTVSSSKFLSVYGFRMSKEASPGKRCRGSRDAGCDQSIGPGVEGTEAPPWEALAGVHLGSWK